MEQIRLDNQLPVKKTDHTSKGDQLKWKIGNIWYKSDYMGYEGLSETLVSHLLQKSSLSHPFVLYQPVRIAYRGTLRSGCSSPDFLKANQMLIPLEKLYRPEYRRQSGNHACCFFRTGGTHSFSGRSDGTHDGNSEFRCISDRYAGN